MTISTLPVNMKLIRRVVIKIGSNILSDGRGIRTAFLNHLAGEIQFLKDRHIETVIVTSGAIASAMSFFKQGRKPVSVAEKQAYAAVGQPLLMNHYAKVLKKKGMSLGQILLTQDGFENRTRFLNAKHTLNALLAHQIIPIINENDTVTVDEIKIGDNDRLSAHVAHLIDADLLVILSHVDGLYNRNPADGEACEVVPVVDAVDKTIWSCIYENRDERTVGGMQTKLMAAGYCMDYGIPVLITNGHTKYFIRKIFDSTVTGTWFVTRKKTLSARKHWISNIRNPKGRIAVDAGARRALQEGKKSLLPSGIVAVSGDFDVGDCVAITDGTGAVFAKGLCSYSKNEVKKIMQQKTAEIEKILGYKNSDEVVHRDDMVVLTQASSHRAGI
ncbi:MAG: glutamate 5-kinase [Deltaproteobacteria bacterium]|nr:glutamate 5-kinase [Deltaproteobacteria bacterium]